MDYLKIGTIVRLINGNETPYRITNRMAHVTIDGQHTSYTYEIENQVSKKLLVRGENELTVETYQK